VIALQPVPSVGAAATRSAMTEHPLMAIGLAACFQWQTRYVDSIRADDEAGLTAAYGQAMSNMPAWVAEDSTEEITGSFGSGFNTGFYSSTPLTQQPGGLDQGDYPSAFVPGGGAGFYVSATSFTGWPKRIRIRNTRWRPYWAASTCYFKAWWQEREVLNKDGVVTNRAWSDMSIEPEITAVGGRCLPDPTNFWWGGAPMANYNLAAAWREIPFAAWHIPSPLPNAWSEAGELGSWRFSVIPGWEPTSALWQSPTGDRHTPTGPFPEFA
jgi:hypothetical protein